MKGYHRYRVTGCGSGAATVWQAVVELLDAFPQDGPVRLGELLHPYERSAYVAFDDAVATRLDVPGPALVLLGGPDFTGPLATRIDGGDVHGFPADALAAGDECRGTVRADRLLVSIGGSLELELDLSVLEVAGTAPRATNPVSMTAIHCRCDDVLAQLIEGGVEDGLGWLAGDEALVDDEPAALARAWRGVLTGDTGSQPPPGVDLLGRGPGATPSGDDVLSGMLLAIDRATTGDRRTRVNATVEALVEAAATRTTTISTALLAQAALGRTSTPVDAMLASLLDASASDDDRHAAVDGMVALGHTSGVDMLLGIVLALRFVLEK